MQEFLDKVGAELQWKPAKPVVLRELRDHLEDSFTAAVSTGLREAEAKEEALIQMGDPVEVGKALNMVHRPKSVKALVIPIAAMLLTSMLLWLFVFYDSDDPFHWIWMPLGCAMTGMAAMTAAIYINWNAILPHLWKIALPGWGLILVLADFFYPSMSSRWTEYVALLSPLVYGSVVYSCRGKGLKGLLLCGAILFLLFWIMHTFLFSALGALCLFLVGAILLFSTAASGGFGRKKMAFALTGMILLAVFLLFVGGVANHIIREKRFVSYYEEIYRAVLHNSRFLGAGKPFEIEYYDITQSMSPYALEEVVIVAEGDYFLASVIYRFGGLFGLILATAIVTFLLHCFKIGLRQSCVWSRILTVTILVPMLLQAVLHVVNNCAFYSISAQLPLLSYGNTYRIVDLCLLGMLFSTFRSRSILRDAGKKTTIKL